MKANWINYNTCLYTYLSPLSSEKFSDVGFSYNGFSSVRFSDIGLSNKGFSDVGLSNVHSDSWSDSITPAMTQYSTYTSATVYEILLTLPDVIG